MPVVTWAHTTTLAVTACLLLAAPGVLADERYLHQLRSEAADTQVDRHTPGNPAPTQTRGQAPPVDTMRLLEAEGNRTEVDQAGRVTSGELDASARQQSVVSWDIGQQTMEELQAGLEREQFEELLRQNYYASYVFYSKLDNTSKALIYRYYQQNADIETLRRHIISLSK